jgi:hypothetical protein
VVLHRRFSSPVTSALLNCLAGKTQDRSGKIDVMSNKRVLQMLTQEGKKTNEIRSCETKEHFVIEKCYRMKNQMGEDKYRAACTIDTSRC